MSGKIKNDTGGQRGKCGKIGRSQSIENDETNTNDIAGASHYDRAEADESIRIFVGKAPAHNTVLGEIIENDEENAKDNLSDYMDELKEESETVGRPSPFTEAGYQAAQQQKTKK